MQVVDVRRDVALVGIISEFDIAGQPLKLPAEGRDSCVLSPAVIPIIIFIQGGLLLRRHGDYFSASRTRQAVVETDHLVPEDAAAAVDQGKKGRVDQVEDCVVRAGMIVPLVLRHVFEDTDGLLEGFFEPLGNRRVGLHHITVENADGAGLLEDVGLIFELLDDPGHHTLRDVPAALEELLPPLGGSLVIKDLLESALLQKTVDRTQKANWMKRIKSGNGRDSDDRPVPLGLIRDRVHHLHHRYLPKSDQTVPE